MIFSKNSSWKKKAMMFLTCQGLSLFGSSITSFALIWYATLSTGSGKWTGALTLCSFLPQMIISFVSGVWADRYPKKKLIIFSDCGIALVTLLFFVVLPFLKNESAVLVTILIVGFLRSIGTGIQTPAVNAVVSEIVPEEHLIRFNGINSTVQSVVQFASPAAAGAILSFSGMRNALLVDVITAAAGIGVLAMIALPARSSATGATSGTSESSGVVGATPRADTATGEQSNAQSSVFADFKEGLVFACKNSGIGLLFVCYGIFLFLSCPAGFQSGLYTSRTFGSEYWYLTAVEIVGFLGMALGGLVIGIQGGFKKRETTYAVGLLLYGAVSCGMGLVPQFWAYLVLMLILGLGITGVQTAATTIIQEQVPQDMQGRLFGMMSILYSGCSAIGMGVFGFLADIFALKILMIIAGAGVVLVGLLYASARKRA